MVKPCVGSAHRRVAKWRPNSSGIRASLGIALAGHTVWPMANVGLSHSAASCPSRTARCPLSRALDRCVRPRGRPGGAASGRTTSSPRPCPTSSATSACSTNGLATTTSTTSRGGTVTDPSAEPHGIYNLDPLVKGFGYHGTGRPTTGGRCRVARRRSTPGQTPAPVARTAPPGRVTSSGTRSL